MHFVLHSAVKNQYLITNPSALGQSGTMIWSENIREAIRFYSPNKAEAILATLPAISDPNITLVDGTNLWKLTASGFSET